MKKCNSIISLVIVVSLIICGFNFTSSASSVTELETQKQQAVNKKSNLENKAEELHNEYTGAREQYNAVKAEVDALDISVEDLSEQLSYLSRQLSEAKTNQAQLEQLMKLHIKYMYENDVINMLELLLESGSIAEFFERFEYLSMIIKYDRDMVDEYKKTQEEINAKTEEMSAKKTELEAQSEQLTAKKEELKTLVDTASDELISVSGEVYAAQVMVSAYDKRITEMLEYERQLAAQNAASQYALAREIGNFPNTEYTGGALEGYTDDDLYLMAAIIHAEAEGEPYEGKIAVGSVVMNRIFSSKFPNTLSGVIYQKNQFEPASSGRLQMILNKGPNPDCFEAAKEVLNGARNTDKLFFWALWLAEERGLIGVQEGIIIGSQFFF